MTIALFILITLSLYIYAREGFIRLCKDVILSLTYFIAFIIKIFKKRKK